jgi:hypothetical protein
MDRFALDAAYNLQSAERPAMTNARRFFLLLLPLLLSGQSISAPPPSVPKNYSSWAFPVMVRKSADDQAKSLAEELAKALGQNYSVMQSQENPTCDFWIEVDHWVPNPGEPGYVIVIQPGGAYIRASDDAQLKTAVAKIKALAIHRDKEVYLPIGILSSYPSIKVRS